MYVVLGASGHVGAAVVKRLSHAGEDVIAMLHNLKQAEGVPGQTVQRVAVDVNDVDALRRVLQRGKRAMLLNPPALPSTDTNATERASARAIAAALDGSGLEKVLVVSTYGAQLGDGIGDLSVLYEFERLVLASGIPAAINRGAYYFTNLDMLLEPAAGGTLPTPFPKDLKLPMVAPDDLAEAAVARLTSGVDDVGIDYVEGPQRYDYGEVADALSLALGRKVEVATTPRGQWEASFKAAGFSAEAARAYERMTGATVDNPELPVKPRRGTVTLGAYVAALVGQKPPLPSLAAAFGLAALPSPQRRGVGLEAGWLAYRALR